MHICLTVHHTKLSKKPPPPYNTRHHRDHGALAHISTSTHSRQAYGKDRLDHQCSISLLGRTGT